MAARSHRGRRRRVLRWLMAPTVTLAVFLLGFVGAPEDSYWLNRSPLWSRGDPFFEDAGERFVGDPILIWRGRPSYAGSSAYAFGGVRNEFRHNSLGLRCEEVSLPKPEGLTRLLALGDSATWGLNLPSAAESYPSQLAGELEPRGRFEVVNGGTIGYSSLQGLRFLQCWLDRLDPDVVTVMLGNNDFQAAGAKDLARSPSAPSQISRWLGRNCLALLARKALLELRADELEQRSLRFQELIQSRKLAKYYRTKELYFENLARVTPAQYGENLREMVRLCRARGTRIVLLSVPMNLVWPLQSRPALATAFTAQACWCALYVPRGYLAAPEPEELAGGQSVPGHPHLRVVSTDQVRAGLARAGADPERLLAHLRTELEDERARAEARVVAAHNLGVWALAGGDPASAAELFERALRVGGQDGARVFPATLAVAHHGLGVCRLLQGRRELARASLLAARECFPFAMGPDYQREFERVVRELGVEWIDLPALFEAEDPELFGSALFHDWVHPNERGNRTIAVAIARHLGD